jgi:hypothetical protein
VENGEVRDDDTDGEYTSNDDRAAVAKDKMRDAPVHRNRVSVVSDSEVRDEDEELSQQSYKVKLNQQVVPSTDPLGQNAYGHVMEVSSAKNIHQQRFSHSRDLNVNPYSS